MTTKPGSREKRVAQRITSDLSALLARGTLSDPGLAGVMVSSVVVTPDLSLARIFVRSLDPEPTPGRQKAVLDGLKRAAGFIRRELGSTLEVRRVPELRFAWDDSFDRASRVEALLAEVAAETERQREEKA